jgi:hypothetical protein
VEGNDTNDAFRQIILGPVNLGNPNEFTMLELRESNKIDRIQPREPFMSLPQMILNKGNPIFH